ncbi:unnamed protein product [Symbiodinium natans]|uniref:Ubiquitin-like domain-containing protein n=1 Tax=Symbiodinium natans TaxID=878477 RepID=A0A812NSU3_9DINO|nr:unnamed protein product [Symbiodinium natans]
MSTEGTKGTEPEKEEAEAAKTLRVVVRSLGGEELLALEADAAWTVAAIASKVELEPKVTGVVRVKLQLDGKVLEGGERLEDVDSGGDLDLTAIVIRESVAGVYAAWACSILILHPDHRAAYLWYDDYWEDPLRESCPQRSAEEWASEETSGTWSLDGVNISAHAIEGYLGDDLELTASIASSPDALKQGISETMLVCKLYHKFGDDERSATPEEKSFYKVCHFDEEAAEHLGEDAPGKHPRP